MNLSRDQAELYAGWFRCLADPTRLEILNLLASERRPLSVGEIVAGVDVGQSTVSEHLRLLAETCFVLVEHRGTSSFFRINEKCIDCFPSAAEFVMGKVREGHLPAPRPGATSRRRGGRATGRQPPARAERATPMTGTATSAPRAARREDLETARALVRAAGLPLVGLDEHFAGFWILDAHGGGLAGLAGAERHGDEWLLRSLVVHPEFQGRGHGRALLEAVLTEASRAGAREVFLLTTDAQPYFAAHGFEALPRTSAPAALRTSAELRGACPDNATLMRLELSA